MKTRILLISLLILIFSCSKNEDVQEQAPVEIQDNFTGIVNLTNLSASNIEVLSEVDQSNVNTDGKFSIYKHSVVVAKNKNLDKPIYFGLPNADQNVNYLLNAKETALYFAMASIPNIRRPYYKVYLKKIKQALYQVPEVQTLETKINQSIAQYGYLNYDFIGTELGNAVDKIIQNMNFEESSYTVNHKATWNPNYSAGKGYYRCDTLKPAGWNDVYDATTQTYKLKRKMFNSTAAVVGVQIGKFNESTQSATLSNNYVGFIEPYYPPNLTSLDGTISNFNQTMEAYSDWVNNGISGLANTDAYSKDNEFIFEAKQDSKDAIIFVNGALDNKMLGLNVAYLFIDNFQDVFEDMSGTNIFSTNDFVNSFMGDLVTDNASAADLANYKTWFIDKNYDLIINSLESKLLDFVESKPDIIVPYRTSLKDGISKGFKLIAGSYATLYKESRLFYKIASTVYLSASPKFSAAIPINFSALDLPPSPVNPTPFNSNMSVTSSINFSWGVTGYTNQTLSYNVYFSSNINDLYTLTNRIATSINNSYYLKNFSSLLPENRYYWQVEVLNQNGMKTLGPVWSFDVGNYPFMPSVGTINASGIGNNSASVGGIIHNDGGSPVLQKGVCYSTTPNPTLANNFTNNGSGDNLFTTTLTNLQQGTIYYVRAYATNSKGTGYGEEYSFTTTGSSSNITIDKITIPAGTFTMGSPLTEYNRSTDEVQHLVTLSSFKMSKYEITNEQYSNFLNNNNIESNGVWNLGPFPNEILLSEENNSGLVYINNNWTPATGKSNYPAVRISWYGAYSFCYYVGGRLPTEAEFEYAIRANTSTVFYTGNCLSNNDANYAWNNPYNNCTNSNLNPPLTTMQVGLFPPNQFGLYDIVGNAREWCNDWYDTYNLNQSNNPTGPNTGITKVSRGGGASSIVGFNCRSASRNGNNLPTVKTDESGFRVVFNN